MNRLADEIISNWYNLILDSDSEAFLDFAEGLNINEFVIENGERVIYFEDGIHYIAHGERMGENDGIEEKEIINLLQEYGVEFREEN